MLSSCQSSRIIETGNVRTDSIYISQVKWDSIYVLDSVFIREKGDTLFVEKTKYKYIERCYHDTLWKERSDTVLMEKLVEKELSKWDGWMLALGRVSLLCLVVLVFIVMARLYFKFNP